MEGLDFKKIENKWQKRWEKEKVFQPEVDKDKEKFFLSFPYPYINAYQHIGHLYTLMRVEAFARYKRLRGFNVLFAQGWHATGSPIINAANRVKEKEPKQIQIMKDMGITGSELKKFEKPEHWITFFAPEFKKDYNLVGMSIDWRREFITTSLNPHYDKFIRWQFRKLKEKGYCIRGKFPVVWDPVEETAVGDHARIEGEGVTTQDFIWIKFKLENSDLILISGTTRPDALYGQSNLWIDPDGDYVIAEVGKEKWVVGREVFYKILNQHDEKAKIIGEIKPKEMIGKWVQGPLVDRKIHILPAYFIKSNVGSGIVYSALEDPVDLYELEKIQSDKKYIEEFNLDPEEVKRLKPIDIIKVSGMDDNLGKAIGEEFGVKSSKDVEKLEKAKGELNKRVFRKGVMRENCGACANMSVPEAQIYLKKHLVEKDNAIMFYELTGKVVSRSLTECVVKIVDNQWFINYNDAKWKKDAHRCLEQIKLYPEIARTQFTYVIDWLHEWACTRKEGLGTKLPWDEEWLIESLSDSTIYMAYYTISHLIKDMPVEEIDDEFFDYVFLQEGKGKKEWEKLRKEFEYWYPMDFRNSGKDLIQNHLTFFIFNHVAIWKDKKYWPKGIGANGWVTIDGNKMSKSLGNMTPVREVVAKFSSDASRLTILNGKEGMDDPNWDSKFAESLKSKFASIFSFITENYDTGRDGNDKDDVDETFEKKSHELIKETNALFDETLFRSAIQVSFFSYFKLLKDYYKESKNNPNKKLFNELCENFIIMLNPFCPHLSEEIWENIHKGKKGLSSNANWPSFDESMIKKEKSSEDLNQNVVLSIKSILEKVGDKEKIYLYVMPFEKDSFDKKKISEDLGKNVEIFTVNDKEKYDPENKAKKAKPGMPSVYVE